MILHKECFDNVTPFENTLIARDRGTSVTVEVLKDMVYDSDFVEPTQVNAPAEIPGASEVPTPAVDPSSYAVPTP